MTNMFWNKWNDEFRGYGEPTNNYNQNTNHQVSNNSNSYNSWSNNWNEPKQNNTSNWDWNYFNNELKQDKKPSNPAKSFDPKSFINEDFMNTNDNWRSNGKHTNIADYDGKKNTSWTQTSYSPKEGFHTVSLGLKYNDKLIKAENGSYKFYDESTNDWYTVYATSKKQIEKYGKGKAACWNSDALGSLISVQYPDGHIDKGVILDVCGQADKEAKIDRWDVNVNPNNQEVTWWVDRFGFGDTKNPRK